MGIGETAALSAAIMWTISSFLWGQVPLKALHLNICKNLVGFLLVFGHVLVLIVLGIVFMNDSDTSPLAPSTADSISVQSLEDSTAPSSGTTSSGESQESFQLTADFQAWVWLALSGLIGIVIGDTFYFRSLQILGPRRALMVATTSPIFAALTGWFVLTESLAVFQLMGISLTILGVLVVVADKRGKKEALDLFPGVQSTGLMLGVAAAICQAIGGAISKVGMERNDCSALEASLIRLMVAAFCSIFILLLRKEGREFAQKFFRWSLIKQVLPASAAGTWIGIWFSQIAFKNTEVGIAQTLLSTSPLFAIPIVYFFQGHKISAIAIAGTLLAICGILLTVNQFSTL